MNKNLQNRIYSVLNNNARTGGTAAAEEEKQNIYGIKDSQQYVTNLTNNLNDNSAINKLNTNIFGLPHQFLSTTDFRFDENNYFGFGFFNN